jgi:glucose-6-phosphate 1-dehydrogenase
MFPTVAQSLASVGLNERGRIVVEKPFGRDLASAVELNQTPALDLPEERIFRIDHYLGKESVEDLLVFRFSNTLLEPVWNRNYVRSVQITMSETIGVEGRGSFYDGVGAIRDVMQNHLLQVTALAAMEPPVGPEAAFCRTRRPRSSRR